MYLRGTMYVPLPRHRCTHLCNPREPSAHVEQIEVIAQGLPLLKDLTGPLQRILVGAWVRTPCNIKKDTYIYIYNGVITILSLID